MFLVCALLRHLENAPKILFFFFGQCSIIMFSSENKILTEKKKKHCDLIDLLL